MKAYITGYAVVSVVYLAGLFLSSTSQFWTSFLAAIVAATGGVLLGKVRPAGIIVVFVLISLVCPVLLLYFMGNRAGVESALTNIMAEYDWARFLYPLVIALITYYVATSLTAYRKRGPSDS